MILVNEFIKQVQKNPENIAVAMEDRNITYKEVNEYSDFFASHILTHRLDQGHIALVFDQCTDMITAVLSVLKAGMTYIPLSDNYPDLRIKYILDDSQTELIITNNTNIEKTKRIVKMMERQIEIINMDEIEYSTIDDISKKRAIHNENAYILYTSGSTGKPKGVMQTQNSILHFARQYAKTIQITQGTRMTLLSSFCHDAAVVDIFSGLLHGATLYPRDLRKETDFRGLSDWLIKEKINVWHSVPTLYRHFTSALSGREVFDSLQYIVLGGENVLQQDIDRYKKFFKGRILVNLYGQSESSFNSCQLITAEDQDTRIHLGDPIEDVEVFVVDENNEEVMPLSVGEIVIASPHIAVGYWNKEQETSEVFQKDDEFGCLYWTKDLGRLEIDGRITWLGRKDNQLKIRGYRVELGDIESCIMELEGIRNAAAIAKSRDDGEHELIVYYTIAQPITKEEIFVHINDRLPDYMRPSIFIELESIPQTASNKVDRIALQSLEVELNRSTAYTAPRNKIEERLASIWQDILGVDKIGIHDNFFELGGHSLKATVLSGRIRKELETNIGVKDIFECYSIAKLSEKIDTNQGKDFEVLEPLEKKEYYPVSSAQMRTYAIQMMNTQNTSYNMPMLLELKGEVDKQKIEKAVYEVVKAHEALRTSFHAEGEEIVQKISDTIDPNIEFKEIKEKTELEDILQSWVRPFNLDTAPLFRVGLVKEDNRYLLLLDSHHIINDGTTMGILAEDFIKAYNGEALVPEKVQYKEFAQWEKEKKDSDSWLKQREYWKKEFEGELPILELPLDSSRGKAEENEGAIFSFEIDKETLNGIKKSVAAIGGTLYMGLIAGYGILLSKYTRQQDIIIGSPIAGRVHPQLEKIAGMFVNTIAVRTQPEGEKKVREYLIEMKQKLLGAYENQEYPFEKIVEDLKIKRDLSGNPLFNTMLVLQNMDSKEMELPNVKITPGLMRNGRAKFDISLGMLEEDDKLLCDLEYRSNLFNSETIERMMKHYVKVLRSIASNTDLKISEIEMLSEEEKQQILVDFNNTKTVYPREKTIHLLFEEQVEKTPDHIAVIFRDESLTYRELNEKSNQLARMLREIGVKPDNIVGITVDRSLEMIIGIFGILKAGGAYLPIDPEYPEDRIKFILGDSGAKVLLQKGMGNSYGIEGIAIDGDYSNYSKENLEAVSNSNNLAYVIYTSGSTGKPKGVMIQHYSLVNRLNWMQKQYPLGEGDAILQKTPFTFDVSLWELFWWSMVGAKVCMLEKGGEKNPDLILQTIEKNRITTMHFVPSMLSAFLEHMEHNQNKYDLNSLNKIFTSGEALTKRQVQQFNKLIGTKYKTTLTNLYGPTEATVDVSYYDCHGVEGLNSIPIGKPIDNINLFVVDSAMNLQPIGVAGELCISGDGLSKGYINRDDLTAEKFIPNPFIPGEKMYRSGDLAKWLSDGNIEFLGRIDHQVKIRGFRIELGEIENTINLVDGVRESVVLVRGNNENKYLCAYIVLDGVDVESIKDTLGNKLPHYMVPTSYVVIDKMPLTSNGKINRQALLNMQSSDVTRKKIPPRNFHDNTIAQIWKEVLNLEELYIHDDFFEMGGNSINIIQVANRISEALEVEITYADLMVYKTVLELSEYIKTLDNYNSQKFKHAFKINNSKSNKKIFIIHGADGSIFYFRHLAKLLEDEYSVYGLQPRGLNGEEPFPGSFFEMIHDYIKEIRMIQSEGPYIIAGYCIGGYLSYDIVNIFELQGDEVTALIQLDEEAFIPKRTHKWIFLYRSILNILDAWRKITKKDKMFTIEKFSNLIPKAKPISRERQLEILKQRRTIQKYFGEELAFGSYYANLGFVKSPTLVIKGEDNHHPLFREDLWRKMVKGKLEYYEVPGDHETVMFPPYVENFAEIIKRELPKYLETDLKKAYNSN